MYSATKSAGGKYEWNCKNVNLKSVKKKKKGMCALKTFSNYTDIYIFLNAVKTVPVNEKGISEEIM